MKKTILSIVALVATSTTIFAQIPNSGFENWTNKTSYSVPDNWGTMNDLTSMVGVYTATTGVYTPTNSITGDTYLKLTSKTVSGYGVVNGVAVSGVLDPATMTPVSGFTYTQRPTNLTGKWQHMIYGSSQGSINVALTRWDVGTNTRIPVASGNVTLSGMAMSWANFSIPLTYVDSNNPDTCIIVLKASGSNPTNFDYLWVDNLAFTGGSVTGIESHDSFLSNLLVFPNPSVETIHINLNLKSQQHITLELTDVIGQLITSKDLGIIEGETKHILNVNGITKGTYFVKVISNDGIEVKKVIIE